MLSKFPHVFCTLIADWSTSTLCFMYVYINSFKIISHGRGIWLDRSYVIKFTQGQLKLLTVPIGKLYISCRQRSTFDFAALNLPSNLNNMSKQTLVSQVHTLNKKHTIHKLQVCSQWSTPATASVRCFVCSWASGELYNACWWVLFTKWNPSVWWNTCPWRTITKLWMNFNKRPMASFRRQLSAAMWVA